MTDEELTRGERTRQAILEAAHELFLENGYGGTSMRQIASAAGGIAVGGIYNHFGSKQDILAELIKVHSPTALMMAVMDEAEGETGAELLADALRRLTALAIEHIDFIQLAYIDIQKFDGAAMLGVIREVVPAAIQFGQRVIEAGGLRSDMNPFVMMRMFVSHLIGFALTERIAFSEGRPRVDFIPNMPSAQWMDSVVDVYLHGVAAED